MAKNTAKDQIREKSAKAHSARLDWRKEVRDTSLAIEFQRVLLTNGPVIIEGLVCDVSKTDDKILGTFLDDGLYVVTELSSAQAEEIVKGGSSATWALALNFTRVERFGMIAAGVKPDFGRSEQE